MLQSPRARIGLLVILFLATIAVPVTAENWLQLKYDSRHSGNVPDRNVTAPLGLIGAVPQLHVFGHALDIRVESS